jgi:hypothetical protein
MPLLNYTTQIAAEKTVSEISGILARAGARAIMTEFNTKGVAIGVRFRIQTELGVTHFALPCDIGAVLKILSEQSRAGKVPRRLVDEDQAARVGWRIIKDWIEAQLALVATRMVTMDQVFLPYAITNTGETVYERYVSAGFNGLQLEAPKA